MALAVAHFFPGLGLTPVPFPMPGEPGGLGDLWGLGELPGPPGELPGRGDLCGLGGRGERLGRGGLRGLGDRAWGGLPPPPGFGELPGAGEEPGPPPPPPPPPPPMELQQQFSATQ